MLALSIASGTESEFSNVLGEKKNNPSKDKWEKENPTPRQKAKTC